MAPRKRRLKVQGGPKKRRKVQGRPAELQLSPAEVLSSSAAVQASPAEVQASPAAVQASPAEVQGSPPEAQASFQDVQASLQALFATVVMNEQARKKSEQKYEQALKKFEQKHMVYEQKLTVSEQKLTVYEQDMNTLMKQYVNTRGIELMNELISFIGQVHKAGYQKKFSTTEDSPKFHLLKKNADFDSSWSRFLSANLNEPAVTTSDHVCDLFTRVANKRNRAVHYSDPEDCLLEIEKLVTKHAPLVLSSKSFEVRYCVPRACSIAKYFLGVYRLQRLACQYIARVLISHGATWKNLEEFKTVLKNSRAHIVDLKPRRVLFKDFMQQIVDMITFSKSYGPKWNGTSDADNADFLSIQSSFKACDALGIFPPKSSHIVAFSILESR